MLYSYYRQPEHFIDYTHSRTSHVSGMDFHLHNLFEIYYLISGDVRYFIEKNAFMLQHGDLLVMNSSEIHRPSFLSDKEYDRITIHFDSQIIKKFNTENFNLLGCFTDRPVGEQNRMRLDSRQIVEIKPLFYRLEDVQKNKLPGYEILFLTGFIELLYFINNVFLNSRYHTHSSSVPAKILPVIEYIDSNPGSDLSLKALENRFYINRYYLSRLFREATGSSLHKYIIYKRISKAKTLLSKGYSVTEAAERSGFKDYSNFLRRFKNTVGISPGQFKRATGLY